jgi:hypothetical protein
MGFDPGNPTAYTCASHSRLGGPAVRVIVLRNLPGFGLRIGAVADPHRAWSALVTRTLSVSRRTAFDGGVREVIEGRCWPLASPRAA